LSLDWIQSLSLALNPANIPLGDDSATADTADTADTAVIINAAHAMKDAKATNFITQDVLLPIQLLWLAQETYIIFFTKII
jgi:hypothetical protein